MAVRKIRNSWWIDFRHEYIRYRKKSPENSRAGARSYEALLRQKLVKGESISRSDAVSDRQKQSFKEFSNYWFETYAKTNNKLSEIRAKKYMLRNSLVPFFGNMSIKQITSLRVEEFKARQMAKGFANKTINNQLTVLSKSLRSAEEWGLAEKIPRIKKLKTPPLEDNYLTKEECDLLLGQLKGIWYDVVFTALNTGLRLGELRGLRWQDINWETRTITVRHAWCDCSGRLVAPKSNRQRFVPLNDALHSLLFQKRKNCGYVFNGHTGQHFYNKYLNQEIARACKSAGIKVVTCHALRHTFASHLAMAGAPLGAIQKLLGHSDIQTTMRYAHLSESTLKETVNLLKLRSTDSNYGHPVGNTPYCTPEHRLSSRTNNRRNSAVLS